VDLEEENCSELVPVLEMLNRYCSKVKEEATISSKATERIKKVTLSLLRAIALQTKIQVSNILRNYGIDFNSLPELENVFSPYLLEHGAPELLARTGLGSDFENLSPREIELGRRRQWKKRKNGKRRIVEYKERYYYVSLLASLAALLNNRNIFDMVANQQEPERHSSLLHDFSNGTVIQDHPLFSIDHKSLKIIFYHDDVELTNEQTKRKHKMSMFYFRLGNILPEYRSKLKSINLLAIVEYRYLKKYGVEKILAPFIKELNILGSDMGYDFQVHNGIIRLRGALLAVVADTPASNNYARWI